MTDTLRQFQESFAARLLRPLGDAPEGAGLMVHVHNVQASLRSALETTFPATLALVGADFFAAMAARFVTQQPPRLGWLSAYGSKFPDFVALYPAACEVAYLADVAQLEWARVHAANMPDTPGLDLRALAGIAPEALEDVRLNLHPAASLITSAFPVFDIWQAHQQVNVETKLDSLEESPQTVLVTRLGPMEIGLAVPGPGDTALLAQVAEEASFATACAAAMGVEANYDLGAGLSRLVALRAFSELDAGCE